MRPGLLSVGNKGTRFRAYGDAGWTTLDRPERVAFGRQLRLAGWFKNHIMADYLYFGVYLYTAAPAVRYQEVRMALDCDGDPTFMRYEMYADIPVDEFPHIRVIGITVGDDTAELSMWVRRGSGPWVPVAPVKDNVRRWRPVMPYENDYADDGTERGMHADSFVSVLMY